MARTIAQKIDCDRSRRRYGGTDRRHAATLVFLALRDDKPVRAQVQLRRKPLVSHCSKIDQWTIAAAIRLSYGVGCFGKRPVETEKPEVKMTRSVPERGNRRGAG